ncbi:gustatory receptor 68a-like [Cylas formicarius]|uniref:gustatory receptor 68a-like n=1 Tax=Cylas formicarius TaxID=197179 RepID=UPI0029587CE6|nr:gustatory receptor 68a-like [Cylas formicarius]
MNSVVSIPIKDDYRLICYWYKPGLTIFCSYARTFLFMDDDFYLSEIILEYIEAICDFLFIEAILLMSLCRRDQWKRMLQIMHRVEEEISVHGYSVVHLYDSYTFLDDMNFHMSYILFRISNFYTIYYMILVTLFATYFKNRYNFLNKMLKQSASDGETLILWNKNFDKFINLYKLLYMAVNEFNVVFGWSQFFLTIRTLFEILNDINYGLLSTKIEISIAITYTAFPVGYLIPMVLISLSCDRAVKSCRNIHKTSHILYGSTTHMALKTKLLEVINFTAGLNPEFNASGFWIVNQKLLSAFFATLITYLIIVIQFNNLLG